MKSMLWTHKEKLLKKLKIYFGLCQVIDDNQLYLSDWEEPASQPDLSTNDSTFVPPAEEKSDEEEPEVERRQRRSKRKKTER